MKIHYREVENGIEIVRCFGLDPKVILPEKIGGRPVIRVSAYAFSARKTEEDFNVSVWVSEGVQSDTEQEKLLVGNAIEEVVFPDTTEEIGDYIFYGCRNLRSLEFSDSLVQIGRGAFTVCSALERLTVRMRLGEQSCVREILGELWQRMDVRFLYANDEAEAKVVFPEHYEEAVENTPARILYTQHHGSGNNFRQCFYNKELDYRKYDELFFVAVVMDKLPVLADLVFGRLLYPYRLTGKQESVYRNWLKENLNEVLSYLIREECEEAQERIRLITEKGLWDRESLDLAVELASEEKKTEMLSYFMNERNQYMQAVAGVKKKKFDL